QAFEELRCQCQPVGDLGVETNPQSVDERLTVDRWQVDEVRLVCQQTGYRARHVVPVKPKREGEVVSGSDGQHSQDPTVSSAAEEPLDYLMDGTVPAYRYHSSPGWGCSSQFRGVSGKMCLVDDVLGASCVE